MPDRELDAILLTHGQPVEVQVRAWVAAIPAAERVEKLIHAYLTCREREETLEAEVALLRDAQSGRGAES